VGTLVSVALFARRSRVVFRARLRPRPRLLVLEERVVEEAESA
jgi:hypothetical protein